MKVVVIGSGPGGTEAAERAAERGHRVTVVERGRFGGTCTNRGCIPAKFLLSAAARESSRGGQRVSPAAWEKIQARKKALVDGLSRKIGKDLAEKGVEILRGRGELAGPREVVCTGEGGERAAIRTDAVILAAGSSPAMPSAFRAAGDKVLTSDEALELGEIPSSVIIVGSGFIGSEFAHLFSMLGSSVTMLEALPHILPAEDEDTAAAVSRELERRGIAVVAGAPVTSVSASGAGITVAVEGGRVFSAALALVSVGRTLNTAGLGLEKAGLVADARGAVAVDGRMETGAPGIYAVGDITGKPMLAHVAAAQGLAAAENLSGAGREMDYRAVPWAVFVSPEVATVGMTEKAAHEAGVVCAVGKAPFTGNIKARTEGEQAGFVKVLADPSTGRLLGGTVVGARAADMIHTLSAAVQNELTVSQMRRVIFIHPTLSESFRAALDDLGRR